MTRRKKRGKNEKARRTGDLFNVDAKDVHSIIVERDLTRSISKLDAAS